MLQYGCTLKLTNKDALEIEKTQNSSQQIDDLTKDVHRLSIKTKHTFQGNCPCNNRQQKTPVLVLNAEDIGRILITNALRINNNVETVKVLTISHGAVSLGKPNNLLFKRSMTRRTITKVLK